MRLISLLGAAAALLFATATTAADPRLPQQMTLANGEQVSLAALRGRVVLINYWASWCVPCRAELPLLARYYAAHRAEGLVVIGISVDPGPNGRAQAVSPGIPYPQAKSVGGRDIALMAVPTSYVIGRDGRLRYGGSAAFTQRSLDTIVAPLLAER